MIVVLLISTISVGALYITKRADPATVISYVTLNQTNTDQQVSQAKEFYLSYYQPEMLYFYGQHNQSNSYPVNASIVSASLKFANRTAQFSYYLEYPLQPQTFWQSLGSFTVTQNKSGFTLSFSQMISDAQSIEGKVNYTISPVNIMLNITSIPNESNLPENVYTLQIGSISFQSAQGDHISMEQFNLQEDPIP